MSRLVGMGAVVPGDDLKALKKENTALKKVNKDLTAQVETLTAQVETLTAAVNGAEGSK